ncbi:ATP-grasp fold amidoligase family protein [Amphibacillus jilinensis]|uniref:ATP-grasp fold amidoligase family protein n=1 Tax=Amphibacillus jilinensis TaxID=1216008 RepID=UPI0002E3FBEE|nr:ATP-grasp fold amidoligase family protein [Amphibacillus jilinensis]
MKKHVYIIVRYSMLTIDGADWKIGRVSYDNYKKSLFDSKRLEQREHLFKSITLPSVASMEKNEDIDFSLLIITSQELPEKHMQQLKEIISPYNWAKIVVTNSENTMIKTIEDVVEKEVSHHGDALCYLTTRLDDDDALSRNFISEVSPYLSTAYNGFCLSFAKGYTGIFNEERNTFESIHSNYSPKIALGLSYINTYDPNMKNPFAKSILSIYGAGPHTNVDQIFPTIVDSKKSLYLRTIHAKSDTISEEQLRKTKRKSIVSPIAISDEFDINIEIENDIYKQAIKEEELKNEIRHQREVIKNMKNRIKQLENQETNIGDHLTWSENEEGNDLRGKLQKEQQKKEKIIQEINHLIIEVGKENKRNKRLTNEKKQVEKKLFELESSHSWRITKPLRNIVKNTNKGVKNQQKDENKIVGTSPKDALSDKVEHVKQLKSDADIYLEKGELLGYLEEQNDRYVKEKKNLNSLYFHVARKLKSHSSREKTRLFEHILQYTNIKDQQEFVLKEAENQGVSLKRLASFRVSMNLRSVKRELMIDLPEWKLNDKKYAYNFIDLLNVKRPWTDNNIYTFKQIPKKTNIAIKPTQGAASRGVYLVISDNKILDVHKSAEISNWSEMLANMEDDIKQGRVFKDEWIIEELIFEDDRLTPARDYKFLCFYGKVELITEISRFPSKSHCWWNRAGEIVKTGVFEKTFFEGNGVPEELIQQVELISKEIPTPFMRIDFLKTKEGMVFGEFTPRPGTFSKFNEKVDNQLGISYLEAEERLMNDILNGKRFDNFKEYVRSL